MFNGKYCIIICPESIKSRLYCIRYKYPSNDFSFSSSNLFPFFGFFSHPYFFCLRSLALYLFRLTYSAITIKASKATTPAHTPDISGPNTNCTAAEPVSECPSSVALMRRIALYEALKERYRMIIIHI